MLILSHKELHVYRAAIELMKEVYRLTKNFPKEEQYGLISQLKRAAVSVCSNIAEGASRKLKKDKRRFYVMARSSIVEIDTHSRSVSI